MSFSWRRLNPFRCDDPSQGVREEWAENGTLELAIEKAGFEAPLQMVVAVLSDQGCIRENNEDRAYYAMPEEETREDKGILVLVADGMGGASAGEVASEMAIRTIPQLYYESSAEAPEALRSAMEAANSAIHHAASLDSSLTGMGTTCVGIAIWGHQAYVAYVGDSRAYLLRGGQIYQVTEDHSVVYEMVKRGLLSREEARNHEDRNVLSRSLGGRPEVQASGWSQPMSIREGDRFLLCSDGVHDILTDEEMLSIAGSGAPYDVARAVVERAKAGGGYDNITVAVVEARRKEAGLAVAEETRATREIPGRQE